MKTVERWGNGWLVRMATSQMTRVSRRWLLVRSQLMRRVVIAQRARSQLRLSAALVAVASVIAMAGLNAQATPRQFAAASTLDSTTTVVAWIEGEYVPTGTDFAVLLTHVRLGVDQRATGTRIRSVAVNAAPCWGGLQHVIPPVGPSRVVNWQLEMGVTVIQDSLVFRVPISQTDPSECQLRILLREGSGKILAELKSGNLRTQRTWQEQP